MPDAVLPHTRLRAFRAMPGAGRDGARHLSPLLAGPSGAVVSGAIDAARRQAAHLVHSAGGSAMDVAKPGAVLSGSRQPIGDVLGVDRISAMVHAIEACANRHRKNPYPMRLPAKLSLSSRKLPPASEQGGKVEVRQAMLLGACLAGQAFATVPPLCTRSHIRTAPFSV